MSGTKEIDTVDQTQQNLSKSNTEPAVHDQKTAADACATESNLPVIRRRLPDERHSLTHHSSIGGQEGYVTVGLYEDGMPGEMFIRMAKEGSIVSGLMDSFATAVSLALQYGVPLQVLCDKFSHTRFEPAAGPAIRRSDMPSH